jgi:hypothetical protein
VNECDATTMVAVDTRRGVLWVGDGWRKSRRDIVNCSYSKRAREGSGKCGNNQNVGRAKVLAEQTLGNRMMLLLMVNICGGDQCRAGLDS